MKQINTVSNVGQYLVKGVDIVISATLCHVSACNEMTIYVQVRRQGKRQGARDIFNLSPGAYGELPTLPAFKSYIQRLKFEQKNDCDPDYVITISEADAMAEAYRLFLGEVKGKV